jgi:hypothetical protein
MRCATGKVMYADEPAAVNRMAILKELSKEPLRRLKRLDVYRCRTCGAWHVGHRRLVR